MAVDFFETLVMLYQTTWQKTVLVSDHVNKCPVSLKPPVTFYNKQGYSEELLVTVICKNFIVRWKAFLLCIQQFRCLILTWQLAFLTEELLRFFSAHQGRC
jgi:hypothetical protein